MPPPRKKIGPPKFGAKSIKFVTTVFMTSALDTAYLWNETSHRQTKMPMSIYNVSLKVNLLFVAFDLETADVHLLIVIYPSAAITLQPS